LISSSGGDRLGILRPSPAHRDRDMARDIAVASPITQASGSADATLTTDKFSLYAGANSARLCGAVVGLHRAAQGGWAVNLRWRLRSAARRTSRANAIRYVFGSS
jgi:hypothetical protein